MATHKRLWACALTMLAVLTFFFFVYSINQHATFKESNTIPTQLLVRTIPQQHTIPKVQSLLHAKVFPISYLNVDEEKVSSSKHSFCSMYLSTYFETIHDKRVLPTILGLENKPENGHWRKYMFLQKFLKSQASSYIGDEDFVFFTDGLDVMFNNDVQLLKDVYLDYLKEEKVDISNTEANWPLLFKSDTNKWPPVGHFGHIKNLDMTVLDNRYTENYPANRDYYPQMQSELKYLNSGMFIGRKRDVLVYLQGSMNMVNNPQDMNNDDQATLQYMYITRRGYPVFGDCKAAMGLPINIACDQLDVSQPNSCEIRNKLKPEIKPIALHGSKCPRFCKCLSNLKENSRLKHDLDREMDKQHVKTLEELKGEPIQSLGVRFYHYEEENVKTVPITQFCSYSSLFEIDPVDKCHPK